MNPRTTAWLALVAAGLAAFVYFYEVRGGAEREAEIQAEKELFPGLAADDVEWIALSTLDDRAARFERREGVWTLVEPVEAPADPTALDAIASALVGLAPENRIADAEALEPFGLGSDAPVVRFGANEDEYGLLLGRDTPVGGHRYVAVEGAGDVLYVEHYRLNALQRNLADLRDRSIVRFGVADVRAVRLDSPDATLRLVRTETGDWRLAEPIDAPAEPGVVDDLLTDLAYLRATAFLDDVGPAALPERQLPRLVVTVSLSTDADAESATDGPEIRRLVFGGGFGDGDEAIWVEGPDGRLFTVAPERLDELPQSVEALRDRRLARFDRERLRRLELSFTEADGAPVKLVALLGEDGWQSESPGPGADAIERLVETLASLEAVEVVAEALGASERAALGLDPPRLHVVGRSGATSGAEDEAPLFELRFGRAIEDRGRHVQQRADGPVFRLDAIDAAGLPASPADLHDEDVPTDSAGADSGSDVGSDAGPAEAPEEIDR